VADALAITDQPSCNNTQIRRYPNRGRASGFFRKASDSRCLCSKRSSPAASISCSLLPVAATAASSLTPRCAYFFFQAEGLLSNAELPTEVTERGRCHVRPLNASSSFGRAAESSKIGVNQSILSVERWRCTGCKRQVCHPHNYFESSSKTDCACVGEGAGLAPLDRCRRLAQKHDA
jgi:hypothetical protein